MPGTKTFTSSTLTAADMNAYARGGNVMAYASKTANQTGITTVTDVTGLSITFTALAGRLYKVSAYILVRSTVANDVGTITITDGSNNNKQVSNIVCLNTSYAEPITLFVLLAPGAGSVTYKVRAQRSVGTGNILIDADALYPAIIVAEDIGTS
jgi:hypothetical protein